MHGRLKFAAWLAALYGSVVATVAAVVVLLGAGMPAEVQAVLSRSLAAQAPMLGFIAALLLAACGGIVAWLFKRRRWHDHRHRIWPYRRRGGCAACRTLTQSYVAST